MFSLGWPGPWRQVTWLAWWWWWWSMVRSGRVICKQFAVWCLYMQGGRPSDHKQHMVTHWPHCITNQITGNRAELQQTIFCLDFLTESWEVDHPSSSTDMRVRQWDLWQHVGQDTTSTAAPVSSHRSSQCFIKWRLHARLLHKVSKPSLWKYEELQISSWQRLHASVQYSHLRRGPWLSISWRQKTEKYFFKETKNEDWRQEDDCDSKGGPVHHNKSHNL